MRNIQSTPGAPARLTPAPVFLLVTPKRMNHDIDQHTMEVMYRNYQADVMFELTTPKGKTLVGFIDNVIYENETIKMAQIGPNLWWGSTAHGDLLFASKVKPQ